MKRKRRVFANFPFTLQGKMCWRLCRIALEQQEVCKNSPRGAAAYFPLLFLHFFNLPFLVFKFTVTQQSGSFSMISKCHLNCMSRGKLFPSSCAGRAEKISRIIYRVFQIWVNENSESLLRILCLICCTSKGAVILH